MADKINYSIHPRSHWLVDKTAKRGDKTNTSKGKGSSSLAAHMAHVERHPTDKASRDHLAKRSA